MPDFSDSRTLAVRTYGDEGPEVLLLHGGPAAPGSIAPVARELSDRFRVIEPFQRRRGNTPLTVQRHIDDLHSVVKERCRTSLPSLVGHSWGAMLALAYAAQHPGVARCIVLIGCGTFDPLARRQMEAVLAQRTNPRIEARRRRLLLDVKDGDVRLCVLCRLLEPLYTYDVLEGAVDETEEYDKQGHDETWSDMVRLQKRGIYPASFSDISVPVLMVHGDWDPHPGLMTLRTLQTYMPQIEYVELPQCGHYPWREKAARGPFFEVLREWLGQHTT
ncbi:MAG: alpha/beta hydrolase [Dehalococcoidia bacterium]|nr:alpha/beta hydrolase [Dehalococcoidia bacterium]